MKLEDWLKDVLADEARVGKLAKAEEPLKAALEAAKADGVEVSEEQLLTALASRDDLPDAVLAHAAGGTGFTAFSGGGCRGRGSAPLT